jgi:hypothetical protein
MRPGARYEREKRSARAGGDGVTRRRAALILAVVLISTALGRPDAAVAAEVAVLPVSYGDDVSPLLEAIVRRALSARGEAPLEAGVTTARVAERYGLPQGIDRTWVEAQAERGEELYYAMSYSAAQQVFTTPEWLSAQGAVVDMALDPALGEAVRRGLMARGRAAFYAADGAATEAALREAVVLFPEWIPPTEWYQPEFVVRYTEVQHDVLQHAGEVRLTAPSGRCDFAVDGVPLGRGAEASTAIADRALAFRVTCAGQSSRVHVLGPREAYIDPRFDEAFDPSSRRLNLPVEVADDAALQAAMGRAYADIVGAQWVVLAGVLPSGELQLVEVRVGEEAPRSAVRARPDRQGTLDMPMAIAALLGGSQSTSVSIAAVDDRRLVFPGVEEGAPKPRSGPPLASWVAFGVGGAGLVLGTVFTVLEGGARDDVEACYHDLTCFSGAERTAREDERERAALFATIGFGVAIAGAITGAILWIVDSNDERPSTGAHGTTQHGRGRPTVGAAVLDGGGWLELSWRF